VLTHSLLAYIDPGTGSMLFTVLIGIVSAGVYAARAALLKLRFILSGGRADTGGERLAIAIFTDSKRYWNLFEPICDELESRGIESSYLTASPDDPALDKAYEHVHCQFIGEGNKSFATMNMLAADVVLSTTPGLDVYQWKRSRDAAFYVHVPHAVSDVTLYRMFGIDYFDAVLLTGAFQGEQVRALEAARELPEKELRVVGAPYMDTLAARAHDAAQHTADVPTVLLAPSWGTGAILSRYGERMLEALLDTGYHIVVRPHPQSFVSEAELMERLQRAYPDSEQLEWNRDNDNFDVLARSDIMISDFSGVIWDYTLAFERPVIYTQPDLDLAPYDACWLDEELWTYKALPQVGVRLDDADLGDMKQLIDRCLADDTLSQGREAVKHECWAYPGESATRIVDYLVEKRDAINHPNPQTA